MNKQLPLKNLLTLYDSGTWGDDGDKSNAFPVLRSSNIKMSKMRYDNAAYIQIPDKDKVKKILHNGDILVTKSSGSPDLIGKCAIFISPENNSKFYFSNFMLRLRPNEEILYSKWLYFFLISPIGKSAIERMNNTTSGLRNLNLTYYLSQLIPLPPLFEQKRIADILDKADSVRQKRKESIAMLDEFLKSVFINMFGDIIINPKNWNKQPLGELCEIRRGASPRPINDFLGGTIPWIKIGDSTKGNNIYIKSTKDFVTEEGSKRSVILNEGSLIFANCGVSLGFARILKIKGCIHDGWLAFENINEKLNKIFLLKLINSVTNYLRSKAPDGTQPNLNTSIMKKLEIPLPSISLQTQFAKIVEQVESTKSKMQESLREMDNQFGSLLQRAFR
jgi:type I restriction enzyme S subunit